MEQKKATVFFKIVGGALVGVINSLLGAGGGMIGVPVIRRFVPEQTRAQATCLAVIFPISIISAGMYLYNGYMTVQDSLIYLIPGALGALAGAFLLAKIPDRIMRRIFGVFMLWAGVRMMLR